MVKEQWTVIEALNWASSFLARADNAGEWLLTHHLQCSRSELLLRLEQPLPAEVVDRFKQDVRRHKDGVPIQYLTGKEEFYGRSFIVNENVLIPRPETEELVAAILKKIQQRFAHNASIRIADIGTGCGAIAVTLALERPGSELLATDISEQALRVAQKNAARLGAPICFLKGHLLEPLSVRKIKVDVLAANPPYIQTSALPRLDAVVRDHEPLLALDGGTDGYAYFRLMIDTLPAVLNEQALIAFEVGEGQAHTVAALLRKVFPAAVVSIEKDINGKDRIVLADIGI